MGGGMIGMACMGAGFEPKQLTMFATPNVEVTGGAPQARSPGEPLGYVSYIETVHCLDEKSSI